MRPSKSDIAEFKGYLRNCTDLQVQGVINKETKAKRRAYAQLALDERFVRLRIKHGREGVE